MLRREPDGTLDRDRGITGWLSVDRDRAPERLRDRTRRVEPDGPGCAVDRDALVQLVQVDGARAAFRTLHVGIGHEFLDLVGGKAERSADRAHVLERPLNVVPILRGAFLECDDGRIAGRRVDTFDRHALLTGQPTGTPPRPRRELELAVGGQLDGASRGRS